MTFVNVIFRDIQKNWKTVTKSEMNLTAVFRIWNRLAHLLGQLRDTVLPLMLWWRDTKVFGLWKNLLAKVFFWDVAQHGTAENGLTESASSNYKIKILCVYITESVCLCVWPLFLMHGHNFGWICTKFGMWHPYTILIPYRWWSWG